MALGDITMPVSLRCDSISRTTAFERFLPWCQNIDPCQYTRFDISRVGPSHLDFHWFPFKSDMQKQFMDSVNQQSIEESLVISFPATIIQAQGRKIKHNTSWGGWDVQYSLSNVILADEKLTSFHQYLRYNHKRGTIAFSTPSAIIWAYSPIASMVSARFSLFEHVIYSWGALHCRQCRAPQE